VHTPEWSGFEYGQVVGYCDWDNDRLVSINCISRWPEDTSVSQEGLCSMTFVSYIRFYSFLRFNLRDRKKIIQYIKWTSNLCYVKSLPQKHFAATKIVMLHKT
jgi:hypothetical protein